MDRKVEKRIPNNLQQEERKQRREFLKLNPC